jgi:hypothetical protein
MIDIESRYNIDTYSYREARDKDNWRARADWCQQQMQYRFLIFH